jgi:bifunctional enzyme CysN/CysC
VRPGFLTCGSVDDGKSSLIGRLLYDSQLILDDQLASLKKESRTRAKRVSTSRCSSTA